MSDIWKYTPLNKMTESVSYLTDVIKNRSTETRKVIREYPRHEIVCDYIFNNHAEFSEAKALAKSMSPGTVLVPWWPYWQSVDGILSSDDTFLIDNADEMYLAGDAVVFISGSTCIEKEVLTASATELVITTPIGTALATAVVCPLVQSMVSDGFDFSRSQGKKINTASVTFAATYVKSSSYQPWPLEDGIPIIDEPSKVDNSLSENILKDIEIFDGDVGNVTFMEMETYFRHNQTLRLMPHGYTERRKIRRFIHWLQGRYQTFYLNTWADETESPTKTLVRSDADRIEIKHHDWDMFTVNIPCAEVPAVEESS